MNLINFLKAYPLVDKADNRKKSAVPESKTEMCCPFCGKPLVKRGQKRLQSTSEHICDPNGTPSFKDAYYCDNPDCEYGKYYCWSGGFDAGEAFSNFDTLSNEITGELDLDKWNIYWDGGHEYYVNALNTFACKAERETEWNIYLHPALLFGSARPAIQVHPVYRKDGSFVKNIYKLITLKKNKYGEYNLYDYSGLHMFFYMIKRGRRSKWDFGWLQKLEKDRILYGGEIYKMQETLKRCYGNESYCKKQEWWRIASEKYMRIIYPRTLKKCLKILKNSLYEQFGENGGELEYKTFINELHNK